MFTVLLGVTRLRAHPHYYHADMAYPDPVARLIHQTYDVKLLRQCTRGPYLPVDKLIMVELLSALFSVVFLLCSGAVALILLTSVWWRESSGEGLVQVVVLGDAGRSPRMQYHCLSLVQLNYNVDLIGYGGIKNAGCNFESLLNNS